MSAIDIDRMITQAEHIEKFTKLIQYAESIGVSNIAYGDIKGGGHSNMGEKIVEHFRSIYGNDAIDYTDYCIIYQKK